jgi:hypothetical protein
MNPVYTPADRTLKATISWGETTTNGGDASWDYTMVFSKDFQSIESGEIITKAPDGTVNKTLYFGQDLFYSLVQFYQEDKLCGTMPSKVENAKEYTFDCEAVGDYVKIVTGRNEID